jgi:hypothetical protein
MNILPINKIILASFAFALTHWKKIVEISIVPIIVSIPFLLIVLPMIIELFELGGLLVLASENGDQKGLVDMLNKAVLPDNTFLYLIFLLYGYIILSINIYRLVILGSDSVVVFKPISDAVQIFRFIGLTLFLGFVLSAAFVIAFFLSFGSFSVANLSQLIVYFLIIPITLNFVNIAIQQPSKYKWNLNFVTQANLFLLQAIIPALIGMIATFLFGAIGLPDFFGWAVKVIVFYWSLVNLAMCYQLISTDTSV